MAHYECSDIVKPSLIVTGNPTNWTKENIVLIAKATDNESGVKGIKLPNGEWVYSDTATFEVTKNGDYVFTAEDNFGKQTTVTVKVTKIDKTPPIDTSIVINNNDLYTFIVKTSGDPDQATYTFNGESGTMDKLTSNIYRKTLKVDINDETVDNEVLPINITVSRNDGTKKSTTLKVHIEGSAYDDYNINLTN